MNVFRLLSVLLTSALAASAATPELSGIYIQDTKALFVMVDPETGASSRWLALGQEFAGYTLKNFQTDTDTIVLGKGGMDYFVKLRATKIGYAATTLSGTIEVGAGSLTRVQRATLVFGEENTFPVTDHLALTIKPVLLKDGNIAYASSFARTESDGRKTVLSSPRVVARPGQAFSLKVGDLGFSLKP